MTKYCPLMVNQYGIFECKGVECGFADEAGHCLIRQALHCYVTKEHTQDTIENNTEHYIQYLVNHPPSWYDPNDPEGWGGLQGGV